LVQQERGSLSYHGSQRTMGDGLSRHGTTGDGLSPHRTTGVPGEVVELPWGPPEPLGTWLSSHDTMGTGNLKFKLSRLLANDGGRVELSWYHKNHKELRGTTGNYGKLWGTMGDGLSSPSTMETTGNPVELPWYHGNGEA
jgi:hypothetical protein